MLMEKDIFVEINLKLKAFLSCDLKLHLRKSFLFIYFMLFVSIKDFECFQQSQWNFFETIAQDDQWRS